MAGHLLLALLAALAVLQAGAAAARVSDVPLNPGAMDDRERAALHIEAEEFGAARALLEPWVVARPEDAEGWSLLGFARRKTGSPDLAMDAYARALELEPGHRGANEYLGTFWLELGRPELARERLAILERACPTGCQERSELEAAIAAYREGPSR